MIHIKPIDSVYLQIDCEKSIAKELSSFFTFNVPNSQYNPAFRKKRWDGKIRLFNILTNKIYSGLLPYILKFAQDRGYKISYENSLVKDAEPIEFPRVYSNGSQIEPHDYQLDSVKHAIQNHPLQFFPP